MNRLTTPPRSRFAALLLTIGMASFVAHATANDTHEWPTEGWTVMASDKNYATLLADLHDAVEAAGMAVVTEAGPTEAAAQRGETIPGNRVVGVFRNDFAVAILRESVPAMIEAPIRFYVTENEDDNEGHRATLSWKHPSTVFAPYITQDTPRLAHAAETLDTLFQDIGDSAVAP
ncbi:DUF302 domain-containing protein [Halomonas sp. N3-2A]|uniref:DUF302 domain-containing protein n=1 Tax=Halomonas sp. N3-2A TaxID=2014541 RepID=UPI000B5B28C3|nr:DUF302 domain-containing protein [Halomonas sp. N3-2A]ASK17840.1 hypothetical protein CEK60_00230 [Halomonas sp. N3-2A]